MHELILILFLNAGQYMIQMLVMTISAVVFTVYWYTVKWAYKHQCRVNLVLAKYNNTPCLIHILHYRSLNSNLHTFYKIVISICVHICHLYVLLLHLVYIDFCSIFVNTVHVVIRLHCLSRYDNFSLTYEQFFNSFLFSQYYA